MAVKVIVGAQWGDEGKGKMVDLLAGKADIVARYQGGANAGHTVEINDKQYILHLVPSGILHPEIKCVIGNGMVIDPVSLLDEIKFLNEKGFDVTGRLFISHKAHLIMPYHKILDTVYEKDRQKIGTTGRGIGPAYTDKVARVGIRIVDLLDIDVFKSKLIKNIKEKNKLLKHIYDHEEMNIDEIVSYYEDFDKKMDEFITDTSKYLNDSMKEGKEILIEGAQGALLDIDHGTYPYVTSSNPLSGGACTGLGIGPTKIDKVTGVMKAYLTRVGDGPFPTEFEPEFAEHVRTLGGEFGATTGRPRRCGWFDGVIAKYGVRVNGLDAIAVTKMDVLDTLESLKICTGYKHQGKVYDAFPTELKILQNSEPVYEEWPGWQCSTKEIRSFDKLPQNARDYLNRISEISETPVEIVSVGSERNQTILK